MKKSRNFIFAVVFTFLCFFTFPFGNLGFVEAADQPKLNDNKASFLYEVNSKTIIYEKNADQRLPIASMTKVATLALVFKSIEEGKIKESDMVTISEHAAETEGSQAFLDENSSYSVGDLIMTVIVASANDSSVALAEYVAGSEQKFVNMMNDLAKQHNLSNTHFENSTGLPAIDHYSSAKDISLIYSLICENELYKKYSKIWMTELIHPSGRKTDIVNTNRLIKTYQGCQSGKTGYTNAAGYCLVASAIRQDMNLVGVVIGAQDSKSRFNQMASLFNYGFNNYQNKIIIDKNLPIYSVKVKNGEQKKVDVYAEYDFVKFMRKGEDFDYSLNFRVKEIKAPMKSGSHVGFVYVLDNNNMVVDQIPLQTREIVKQIKVKDILNKIYNKF